jgi:putative NADPH-quinone reductase
MCEWPEAPRFLLRLSRPRAILVAKLQVSMSKPVLFILAHPDLNVSRANRILAATARGVEGVVVHDIYETYPDLFIDGARERRRLEETGALVLQFPFFWYGAPGLLKEWIDRTFVAGWAYGRGGRALRGKPFLVSISTGSGTSAYGPGGIHNQPIEEYLFPFEQIAHFCGMVWQKPLVFYRARHVDDSLLGEHAEHLRARLRMLESGAVF